MAQSLIVVAGNIGAGKTSLTDRLGDHYGWQTAYEPVANNPYLADFYESMSTWSMRLQVYFLGARARQYVNAAATGDDHIFDRSIFEDAHIFARALYARGDMTDRDYRSYSMLYQLTVDKLPPPRLLLYLKASPDTLMARIHKRGREIEKSMDPGYLAALNRYYEEWMAVFKMCPVLTIPADDLDFVAHPNHFDLIVDKIDMMLSGHDEVVFP